MQIIGWIVQITIALGIFNVWVLRFSKKTDYRGGSACNMREEFAAYGLPVWFMWVIGASKIVLAVALIVGIWIPALVMPTALFMAALMTGAIAMHSRVGDTPAKYLPAAGMLALSLLTAGIAVL